MASLPNADDIRRTADQFAAAGLSAQEAADSLSRFSFALSEVDYASIEGRLLASMASRRRSVEAEIFRCFMEPCPTPAGPSDFASILYGHIEEEPDPLALSPLAEAIQGGREPHIPHRVQWEGPVES